MPTDVLETVFKASGVQTVITSMTAAENAMSRLALADQRFQKAVASGDAGKIWAADLRMGIASRRAAESAFEAAAASATAYLGVVGKIVDATQKLIENTQKYADEVMNIKALTGASTADAAGAEALFRGGGVSDRSAMRSLLHLNQDVFSGQGRNALSQLGISPSTGESSLELFNQIAAKLSLMQDGFRKTQIEEALFGERGIEALQPILRMSSETREALEGMSNAFDDKALRSVQKFEQGTALLNAAWQNFENKMGVTAMQALEPVIDGLDYMAKQFERLDKAMGGNLEKIILFTGALVGIGAGVMAVGALINAFEKFQIIQKGCIALQLILDALEGPAGIAAIAAAGALAVGAGILINSGGSDGDKATDKFSDSVDRFGDHIDRMRDQINSIPRTAHWEGGDMNRMGAILRMVGQGAIG